MKVKYKKVPHLTKIRGGNLGKYALKTWVGKSKVGSERARGRP